MNELWRFLDGELVRDSVFTPESVLLSLLLAFVLGQMLAWVYYGTHTGLSYSRSYVQALVLITVVVALVMAVIGNSIITAFGLMGALAIVRFRNMLKDTRDVAFIFCALVIGMAAGSQRYAIAVVGALALCSIGAYLRLVSFGAHHPQNAFLRFALSGPVGPDHPLPSILKRYCRSFSLISTQSTEVPGRAEYAYQLTVRDYRRNDDLLSTLKAIAGMEDVSLTLQEELLEV
jgi:uncharacterized membrane protein YhiD involved in acid resistance